MRRLGIASLLLTLLLGGCGAPAKHAPPRRPAWPLFTSQMFGASLHHPTGWTLRSGYMARLAGKTGYVQLGALQGTGLSPRQAAQAQVTQALQPFGKSPTLTPERIDGESAYLITPSPDQAAQWQKMAEVVVLYPKPREIAGTPYRYLLLSGSQSTLGRIAASLHFLR